MAVTHGPLHSSGKKLKEPFPRQDRSKLRPASKSLQPTVSVDNAEDDEVEETIITDGAFEALSERAKQLVQTAKINFKESKKRQLGFPSPEELPRWFPEHIRNIYLVDRHGGALSYKELRDITRYRALLEIAHRRKWKKYLKVGEMRWKLQKSIRRQKPRSLTTPFYEYRKHQYIQFKEKALSTWLKLENLHRGTLILDETININFRQERMIYAKKLASFP